MPCLPASSGRILVICRARRDSGPCRQLALLRALVGAGMATAELMRRCRRQEVRANRQEIRVTMVNGASLRDTEVSTAVYQDFLPAARAVGAYQAAPEPRVIGHGLQHIPAALETQHSGVSRHEDRRVPGCRMTGTPPSHG